MIICMFLYYFISMELSIPNRSTFFDMQIKIFAKYIANVVGATSSRPKEQLNITLIIAPTRLIYVFLYVFVCAGRPVGGAVLGAPATSTGV